MPFNQTLIKQVRSRTQTKEEKKNRFWGLFHQTLSFLQLDTDTLCSQEAKKKKKKQKSAEYVNLALTESVETEDEAKKIQRDLILNFITSVS